MKNFTQPILLLCVWALLHPNLSTAQRLTVPDYAYGAIQSQYGTVTNTGVTNPGPYGAYVLGEKEKSSALFMAKGYRWWGYASYPLLICGPFPPFNFPGNHGIVYDFFLGCMNPPIGYMASWGGIIADTESRTIWGISGSRNHNGPTASYCIPNPFGSGLICYPPGSTWGYGSSYGYLRKAFVVQSTGALQQGDPVGVTASLTAAITSEGEGTATGMGVLFLNRISEAPWYQYGFGREYLTWGTIEDFLGSPIPLTKVVINQSGTQEVVANMAIGDTIIVEMGFNNTIKHNNPGSGAEANEGWTGREPHNILVNPAYARTDSIKKIIRSHGNRLTYELTCSTPGALLVPLTPSGYNLDEDKDGIIDTREKGTDGNDNNFDGNNDRVPDYLQANVASFHTYDGEKYVTLAIPEGLELSQVMATSNPSPADTPADAEFPWGFFDFSIDGLELGETVTVSLTLHDAATTNTYYKYGMTPDNIAPHWYEFMYDNQTGAIINGNTTTLHFVDGLRGDEDITVNGSIKEPGGPAKTEATGVIKQGLKALQVSIYPNPVESYLNIQMQNGQPGDYFMATIYTMAGKLVHQEMLQVTHSHQTFTIGTNHLAAGIYVVKLTGNNISHHEKIIKIK
ncbi:MAG: T9SS type A sorting domain-containing protein [Breznakibacter sp.]